MSPRPGTPDAAGADPAPLNDTAMQSDTLPRCSAPISGLPHTTDSLARRPSEEDRLMLKQQIYEKMNPRRRKFVDRLGFEQWDPFQEPKHPIEMRQDVTGRTAHQLMHDFLRTLSGSEASGEFSRGALECAMGIVNRDERVAGCLAFCVWYAGLSKTERNS